MDEQTDKGNQYTYDGQRQKSAINIPAIDEETDKGNQSICSSIVGIVIALVSLHPS
jgi:hypothetical protein